MSRALPVRITPPSEAPAPKPARRKALELARVMLLNPRTIGALTSAQQLGAALRCRLDGATLIVEVDRG